MPMVRGSRNPLFCGLFGRLRRARRQSGLKRLPLATKAGLSDSTIAAIEAGEQLPTVGTVARLAIALGLSPAWLAYRLGEERAEGAAPSYEGMDERLRTARAERSHTRAELSRLAVLNPGTIAKIEDGGQAGVDTIEHLATALRISPAWLAYGIGERELPPRRRTARQAGRR